MERVGRWGRAGGMLVMVCKDKGMDVILQKEGAGGQDV